MDRVKKEEVRECVNQKGEQAFLSVMSLAMAWFVE